MKAGEKKDRRALPGFLRSNAEGSVFSLPHPLPLPPCSLALHNLAMVLAHLYSCGLVRADVLYGYLGLLRNRLSEPDVDVLVTMLGSVGLQLRSDDPVAMKDFVVGVHARAAELGKQGERSGGDGGGRGGTGYVRTWAQGR